MLKENLVMLRRIHGFSQEEISEKIGISGRLMPSGRAAQPFLTLKNAACWQRYTALP